MVSFAIESGELAESDVPPENTFPSPTALTVTVAAPALAGFPAEVARMSAPVVVLSISVPRITPHCLKLREYSECFIV